MKESIADLKRQIAELRHMNHFLRQENIRLREQVRNQNAYIDGYGQKHSPFIRYGNLTYKVE